MVTQTLYFFNLSPLCWAPSCLSISLTRSRTTLAVGHTHAHRSEPRKKMNTVVFRRRTPRPMDGLYLGTELGKMKSGSTGASYRLGSSTRCRLLHHDPRNALVHDREPLLGSVMAASSARPTPCTPLAPIHLRLDHTTHPRWKKSPARPALNLERVVFMTRY